MAGTRKVRVEGSDDDWEVLAETESTMLLVNHAARHRRHLAELQQQLDRAKANIEDASSATPINGNEITGP